VVIVEYYIRQVLYEGIQRLRGNLNQVNEIFAELACPPLDKVFGEQVIKEIRCFFAENDIPVRSAFSPNQIDLPSLTVHLISSQEDPQYRSMQDHMGFQRVPKEPTVIQGPFYGVSYDSSSGQLHLPKTMDLSQFINGRKIFSAEDDAVYTIKGTIKANEADTPTNELKDQYVTVVDSNSDIADSMGIAKLYLLSSIDFSLKRIAGSFFREVFEIRINAATNSDQAVWLYYITSYILMRNKAYFEQVGLESQTYSSSDFNRDAGKMPNSIWGRTIRLTFLVQHTWSEDMSALELFGVDINAASNVVSQIVVEDM